jgi:hypothetical protein
MLITVIDVLQLSSTIIVWSPTALSLSRLSPGHAPGGPIHPPAVILPIILTLPMPTISLAVSFPFGWLGSALGFSNCLSHPKPF